MTLGERITMLREQRGWTMTDLAERSGVSTKNINAIEKRKSEKSRHAPAIAAALDVPLALLLSDTPLTHGPGSLREPPPAHYGGKAVYQSGKPGRLRVSEILRATTGGNLHPHDSSGPLGFVDVATVTPNLIALRVRGDALAPAIEDGEILLVNTAAACAPGSKVLVTLRDGGRLCKRLLFQRSDAITLADLASRDHVTLDSASVERMQPIVAVYSADTWRSA